MSHLFECVRCGAEVDAFGILDLPPAQCAAGDEANPNHCWGLVE